MDADRQYMLLAMRAIGEFGAVIAVPVVVFALSGKWLDARFDTAPAFLIAGFALAAVLSSISIVRKAKAFGKRYEAIGKKMDEKMKSERS